MLARPMHMEEEMTGSDDLKIAIVGMRHGHVGKPGEGTGYLETLKHVRGAKVVAYCEDSDAELLAQAGVHQPGAALYDNVDDLIANEDFDVGWIVLPAAEVPGAGIKLADAGKHFYMEKQFARTVRRSPGDGTGRRSQRREGAARLPPQVQPRGPGPEAND